MASDELVWSILDKQFCSFKIKLGGNSQRVQKSTKSDFCKNPHNVSGICSKLNCPLANSRYATVREDPKTQQIFLYIKAVERAHLPSKWWEKIPLDKNLTKALHEIDEQLIYWPKAMIHKCKQRLTRLLQVQVRARRLAKEDERLGERIVARLPKKIQRREATRERKALSAANIERAIERELIERLRSGAYGDKPLNVEENVWKKVMRGLERSGEGERDVDLDEGVEEENEYEYEGENAEYVSDFDSSDDDGEDLEDFADWLGTGEDGDDDSADDSDEETEGPKRKRPTNGTIKARKKTSKGPSKAIEYEHEYEPVERARELA